MPASATPLLAADKHDSTCLLPPPIAPSSRGLTNKLCSDKNVVSPAAPFDLDQHVAARTGLPSREIPFVGSDTTVWCREKAELDTVRGRVCSSPFHKPDLWLVHNKWYDLQKFAACHPGGEDWIRLTQGQDVTEAYEAHHLNTEKVNKVLDMYYVEDAAEDYVSRYCWDANGFYPTLKRRVAAHFLGKMERRVDGGASSSPGEEWAVKKFFFTLTSWGVEKLQETILKPLGFSCMKASRPASVARVTGPTFIMTLLQFGIIFVHFSVFYCIVVSGVLVVPLPLSEAAEGASSSPTTMIVDIVSDLLFGVNFVGILACVVLGFTLQPFHGIGHNALHMRDNVWMYFYDFCGWKHHKHRISHALAHHLHPNTMLDLEHPEPFSYTFTCNTQKNSRFVVLTGPFFAFTGPLKDILFLWHAVFWTRSEPFRPEYLFNVLQLAFLIVGADFNPFVGFWYFCVLHVVVGTCIEVAGFALHRSIYCWTEGDKNPKYDWGEHCLSATADHDVSLPLLPSFYLFQILNNHGIHHLFPTVDRSRMPEIMPIFRETCEEFGVPWREYDWRDMFGSLWKNWLKGEMYGATPMVSTPAQGGVVLFCLA